MVGFRYNTECPRHSGPLTFTASGLCLGSVWETHNNNSSRSNNNDDDNNNNNLLLLRRCACTHMTLLHYRCQVCLQTAAMNNTWSPDFETRERSSSGGTQSWTLVSEADDNFHKDPPVLVAYYECINTNSFDLSASYIRQRGITVIIFSSLSSNLCEFFLGMAMLTFYWTHKLWCWMNVNAA